MPISLPGFASHTDFFNLFLPLKKTKTHDFVCGQTIAVNESWFNAEDSPEHLVPFTEDCLRAIKQMICQYADLAQKKFVLRALLQCIPNFPVELINATHNLYIAIVRKEHIDIAVLNTLGLAASHLLAEGNVIAKLAQLVRDTVLSWVGNSFLSQFLHADENNSNGSIFIALAVLAIALKHWMSDPLAPQRRLLQLPPYLANLTLRVSQYWDQLSLMSQHAAAQCLLPANIAGQDYLCVKENVDHSRTKRGFILERNIWTCEETAKTGLSRIKQLQQCEFEVSAATLKQVSEQGIIASFETPESVAGDFLNAEENTEPPPVTSGGGIKNNAAALVLPVVAGLGLKKAGHIALGTSIATFMGYGWYSMFIASHGEPGVTEEMADLSGILTGDERGLLENLASRQKRVELNSFSQAPVEEPFNLREIRELENILAGLSEKDERAPAFLAVRKKRAAETFTTTPEGGVSEKPLSRQDYWTQREQQATNGTVEKQILALLKRGPQPFKHYSLAVPRECFPLADAWFTRMDQLAVEKYSDAFQRKLLALSMSVANDRRIKPPDAALPVKTWLHLGKYYEKFYKKILHSWAKVILIQDALQSAEYASVALKMDVLLKNINRDWKHTVKLATLDKKCEKLYKRHLQLESFTAREQERISGILKHQNWAFSRNISINEFTWSNYRLSYLENIELSKFTTDYAHIIKGFIRSNVDWWSKDSGTVDLVDLYTGMSVLAISRLRDGMKNGDIKKAYNYAVLNENLKRIINENIARLWNKEDQNEYLRDYNEIANELPPQWHKMRLQLQHSNHTREITQAPEQATNVTELPLEGALADVDWKRVSAAANITESLPEQRFSVANYVQQKLKTALDETVKKMVDIANNDILNPDKYIESWTTATLRSHGQEGSYTCASRFKVDSRHHPDEDEPDMFGIGGPLPAPQEYTLQQIVRGVHWKAALESNAEKYVDWPDSFSAELREKLENDITGNVKQQIIELFDNHQQDFCDLYRIMTRRAALSYLARKNAVATADFYHNAFANAVAMYINGKIDAQLVLWHEAPMSGLIYIPIEKAVKGGSGNAKCGVFLSIWNNDYYEVPWPGLAQTQRLSTETAKYRSYLVIEGREDFQNFMEKYRTLRVSRNLAQIENIFDYKTYSLYLKLNPPGVAKLGYFAPFTFTTLSANELTNRQIDLYREDLQDLYHTAIFSEAELNRAKIHERLNALAIVFGVLLVGAGMAFSAPAWVWVTASMATTLLVEVVPHAVLASQANSEEERDIYVRALVMAIAFEVTGTIGSEAAGPVLKAAVNRFARLSSTTFRTTLPRWHQFTKEKLEHLLIKSGVRTLRKPASETPALSQRTKTELDKLIAGFKTASENDEGAASLLVQAEEEISDGLVANIHAELWQGERRRLQMTAEQMGLLHFETHYRVVTQWKSSTSDYVRNTFYLVGKRDAERVVVNIITDGADHSYFYMSEDDWLFSIIKDGERKKCLISYYDFDQPETLHTQYHALTSSISSISASDYPKAGRHIFVPEDWKEKITAFGLKFDDMQKIIDEIHLYDHGSLAQSIRQTIEESPELQRDLATVALLPPPKVLISADEASNNMMERAANIIYPGADIEKFYPLPKWTPFIIAPEEYVIKWNKVVEETLKSDKQVKMVADNFVSLKAAGGAGVITAKQIEIVESELIKLYAKTEKFAVLFAKAKHDILIREQILVKLASLVNSIDPRVLGESYQFMNTLAERLHQMAHFHVIEQKLSRIIPMTAVDEFKWQAFVVTHDPSARIIIVLPTLNSRVDIASILMHEMTHHAVDSADFRYLYSPEAGFPTLSAHHDEFGKHSLNMDSSYEALGQSQQFIANSSPKNFKPLTEYDRALAQVRVKKLPMLGAYAKTHNADSQVVFINSLLDDYEFTQNTLRMPGGINADEWTVTPVSSAGSRKKRSATLQKEDIFYRQFQDDVLVSMLYQASTFTKADIWSDAKMAELGALAKGQ